VRLFAGSFVVLAFALLAVGCGAGGSGSLAAGSEGSSKRVTRAEYGSAWPLTVNEGTLGCQPYDQVTFTTDDGTV
jgi:hypothetical protein